MDILEQIRACENEEELRELAEEAIEYFTNLAHKENKDSSFIGSDLDINPTNYHLAEKDFAGEKFVDGVNIWNGYVPKGMKINYGRFLDDTNKLSLCKGCYYYVDDDSYIYEFYRFIKNQDIENDFDIISAAYRFTEKYFDKKIGARDREEIHKLIYENDKVFFRPIREHSFKNFKQNGSAMCTERALMAENLISVMGLEIIYMMDMGHAYNIYAHYEGSETEIYVLDFANWVECYNVNFKLIGTAPFMGLIEGCNNEMIDRVVNGGERIEVEDYYLYSINGGIYRIPFNESRNYGTDFGMDEKKGLVL